MILRPRQKQFVDASLVALKRHGNALSIAPTGAGKTIMLSAIAGRHLRLNETGKALVLAHRQEITDQNIKKLNRVHPDINATLYNADTKDWSGDAVFAMVQTLTRDNNLETMPSFSLLVCDEVHHIVADSYIKILNKAKSLNPKLHILGVTATPNRGDSKGLRKVFDNVADQIYIQELIADGYLVKPKVFVIDIGTQDELRGVRRIASDFDMNEVASIMNKAVLNDKIVEHWKEKAGDRKTVVFCSTVAHSMDMCTAFLCQGINAAHVDGETPDEERRSILSRLDKGNLQVVTNVAVLTEGWDCPPVSCVVLLRPCSYKSTMIQMVGRGLRTVAPNEYPHIVKTDCLVLDFGTSFLTHGNVDQEVDLDGAEESSDGTKGEAPQKECPECKAQVPLSVLECPLCNHIFEKKKKGELKEFVLSELDIFKRSNFKWLDLYDNGDCFMAPGFNAWGAILRWDDKFFAVGGHDKQIKLLAVGERLLCTAAANDFMNEHETEDAAYKTRVWLRQPASDRQLAMLGKQQDFALTKYRASCMISLKFNKQKILQLLKSAT